MEAHFWYETAHAWGAREGDGTPLQYSCLENPIDRGAWWAAVHGVAKSRPRLSNFTFTFTFHFHALEKEMATHSSVLAWRIPGTGQPGGLPSMGSHRVRHDWSNLAAAAAACLGAGNSLGFMVRSFLMGWCPGHIGGDICFDTPSAGTIIPGIFWSREEASTVQRKGIEALEGRF